MKWLRRAAANGSVHAVVQLALACCHARIPPVCGGAPESWSWLRRVDTKGLQLPELQAVHDLRSLHYWQAPVVPRPVVPLTLSMICIGCWDSSLYSEHDSDHRLCVWLPDGSQQLKTKTGSNS